MNNHQGNRSAHMKRSQPALHVKAGYRLAIGVLAGLSLALMTSAVHAQTMTAAAASPAGSSGGTQSCGSSTGPTSCSADSPASKSDKTVDEGGGNPINVITGNKYQREVDLPALPGVLGLELVRHYNSQFSGAGFPNGIMGRGWKLSYETDLYVVGRTLQIVQADGARLIFNRDLLDPSHCGTSRPSDGRIAIRHGPRGDEYEWTWPNGRRLSFDARGKLVQIAVPTGEFVTLQHDAGGHLVQVTDPQGRQLKLNYAEPNRGQGQAAHFTGVQSIDTPVGRFAYEYGSTPPKGTQIDKIQLAANLVKVHLPTHYEADKPAHPLTNRGTTTSSVSRAYHYEDARFPTLLTGISVSGSGSDGKALNQRISTYGYDQRGWAVLSEHGGLKVELAVFERASLSELPGSTPGRSVLVHGRTAERPEGRRLEIRSAMVAGGYRITETRGEPCVEALPCPRANMRYRYDAKGRLIEEIQLDSQGRPLLGVRTTYDPMDRVVRVNQVSYKEGKPWAERLMVRYEYGASGEQPTLIAKPSIVGGREHQIRLTYNGHGQVLSTEESGYSPLDEQGLPITRPDQATPIKRITHYEYGRINGRSVLMAVNGPLPGDADTTRFRWDSSGSYMQSMQSPGNYAMKVLQRDAAGRATLIAEDDGSRYRETITSRDHVGHVLARTVVAWLRESGALSNGSRLSQRIGYDYDAHDRLVAIHSPDGTHVRTEFDANGRPSKLILPDGGRIALERDAGGSLLSVTRLDAKQRALQSVKFGRDDAERLVRLSDDLGQMLAMRYSSGLGSDRPSEVEHPGDVKTTYAYDELGFITEQVRAAGTEAEQRTRWQHDADGRVTSIERTSKQSAVYDDFGRKLLQTDREHGITRYVWDAADRLVARVDESEQVRRYEYDAAGRLIAYGVGDKLALARTRYDGRLASETTAFDLQGRSKEHKQWRYDSLGRLVEERHSIQPSADAKATALEFVTTLRYDERGRLTERTLVDTGQREHRLQYTWNNDTGHLNGVMYNDQPVVTDLHASWLGGITAFNHGNGVAERFERDARGRLLHHTAQVAMDAESNAGGSTILDDRYAYDGRNRLVTATESTGERPLDRLYGYDQLGRLVSEQQEDNHTPDTYAYDSEGNRLRSTVGGESRRYAYVGQRLVAVEPTARQAGWGSVYTALGEPWRLWELQGKSTTARKGEPLDQHQLAGPLAVREPTLRTIYASGSPALAVVNDQDRQVVARYGWGLRGERTSKTTMIGAHQRTIYYLYQDGGSRPVVADTRDQGLQLYAEADEAGHVKRQYVYLDGQVVACIDTAFSGSSWEHLRTIVWSWFNRVPQASSEVYAVHTDQRHAPVAVSNAQGQVIWRARYEAFGLAHVQAMHPTRTSSLSPMGEAHAADIAPAFELNLRLPGQYWDAERTTHYNLHRDYDPETGRFITADPISMLPGLDMGPADRLAGGNVYAYVSNNPLTQIDIQGYYQEDIHYYMTFFLALTAGVDYEGARIIALATQYIDDNPDTRPLDPDNPLSSYLSDIPGAIDRLSKYHFTQAGYDPARKEYYPTPEERAAAIIAGYPDPGNVTYEDAGVYADRRINNPSNPQLDRLIAAVQRAPTRCASLQFFGEYLHAFEDTFAHRNYKNEPIAVKGGIGHFGNWEEPDKTYNGWGIDSVWPWVNYNTREARTLEMEKEVFAKMEAFKAPTSKAVSLSQLEPILKQFNAIKESGTDFGDKIKKLNDALKQFGITQPNGQAIDLTNPESGAYKLNQAEKNRNQFLCDKNGKRLNQTDYQGTILPKGSVPCK